MNTPTSFWGIEVGFPVALLLLLIVFLGAFLSWRAQPAVEKAWSGTRETSLSSRLRNTLPRICFALGAIFIVLGLADVARRYTVTEHRYMTNRLIVTLDNSSSMYNFGYGDPIHCADQDLKRTYPRIWGACLAMARLIDETEEYAKKKHAEDRKDQIAILRFGLNSFVESYATSDYDRLRAIMKKLNWRDPRTGIFTEIHLALWDMYQVALQRNARGTEGFQSFSEEERLLLARSLSPEGLEVRYHVPLSLEGKLRAMRADLRDTAFIIISDAQEGQFEQRLDKAPVSLVKMMQLAEYLEVPVYVVSIYADNERVRKLASQTGYGPMGGKNRGAFYLLKGEKNFADMGAIVDKILSARFRFDSRLSELRRESFASLCALLALILIGTGLLLSLSPWGRVLSGKKGG